MSKRYLLGSVLAAFTLATLALSTAAEASDGQERAVSAGASLIGTPAPPLTLRTIDGETIDLGRLYGHRPIYLKFWATWCVPCREQMPHFEKTYEQRHKDLTVIAVNAGFNDTVDDIRAYRKQMNLTMPIVLDDGRLADALHLRVTPQHIVIGRDGKILYIGHLVDDRLEQALASACSERPSGANNSAVAQTPNGPRAVEHDRDTIGGLTVKTTEGTTVSLADATRTQRTILAFISPWCESYLARSRPERAQECQKARESIENFVKAEPKQRVIGIASGLWADKDDALQYQHEHGLSIPVTLDESGALFRRFGVKDVPTFIVIDAAGRVTSRSNRLQEAVTPSRSS